MILFLGTIKKITGDAYAQENGSFGVATLQRHHVAIHGRALELTFRGKSGGAWKIRVTDDLLRDYFPSIPRTPGTDSAICSAVREGRSTRWEPVSDTEINTCFGDIPEFPSSKSLVWQLMQLRHGFTTLRPFPRGPTSTLASFASTSKEWWPTSKGNGTAQCWRS